jgi:hypothetical protein
MRDTPHSDIELMPQIQVLDFKPVPRPEPGANENRRIRANIATENAPIPSHIIAKPCRQHFREGHL